MAQNYQRKTLVPLADVGPPGPLPLFLQGLADVSLADLVLAIGVAAATQLDLLNTGFFPVPDPPVFGSVTNAQLRIALSAFALYDDFDTGVNALADQDMVWRWYFENTFSRGEPLVILAAAQVGISDTTLDDIFTLAATVAAT